MITCMVFVVASCIDYSESISPEEDDRLSSLLQELCELSGSWALKDLTPDKWDTYGLYFSEEPIF